MITSTDILCCCPFLHYMLVLVKNQYSSTCVIIIFSRLTRILLTVIVMTGSLMEVFWGMEAPPLLEGPPLLFSHHQSDVIIRHTAKPIMEWWEASVEISGLTLSLMIMLIGRVSMSLVWDYSNIGFVVITVEESEDMEVCRPFLPSAWPRMSACNSQGHL